MRCKLCNGECESIGGGKVKCVYCGSIFTENETSNETSFSNHTTRTKSDSGADVFEKNINGILEISCIGEKGSWSGSGFIISESGYAITNAHVAADDTDGKPCRKISVRVCGQVVAATVTALADDKAGNGSGIDLAIIKLAHMPTGAKALTFADADSIRNGEPVYVIGNSLGQGVCITSGIVSDKARNVNGKMFIMTDCAVNGGNSGGPIFNEKGFVIGTVTLQGRAHDGGDAEGMNYAIPSSAVTDFIHSHTLVKRTGGLFDKPSTYSVKCPKCGKFGDADSNGYCYCKNCGHAWRINYDPPKVCPKCKSSNIYVENNIYYCMDCDYEW